MSARDKIAKGLAFLAGLFDGFAERVRPKVPPTVEEMAKALEGIPMFSMESETIDNEKWPNLPNKYIKITMEPGGPAANLDAFDLACNRRMSEYRGTGFETNSVEGPGTLDIYLKGLYAGTLAYCRIGGEWFFKKRRSVGRKESWEDSQLHYEWLAEMDFRIESFMDDQNGYSGETCD